MYRLVGFLITMFLLPAVSVGEPINPKNWKSHPSITEIRDLYHEINKAALSDRLLKESKRCELYGGNVVVEAELYRDRQGAVKKYVVDGGSGDSRDRAEYYYDSEGALRFTFRQRDAVNGTWKEFRIYFDAKGRHLFSHRIEGGPGYTDGGLADRESDPASAYAGVCKE